MDTDAHEWESEKTEGLRALIRELAFRGVSAKAQVSFPVCYKGHYVGEYLADLVVEEKVIVELKCLQAAGRLQAMRHRGHDSGSQKFLGQIRNAEEFLRLVGGTLDCKAQLRPGEQSSERFGCFRVRCDVCGGRRRLGGTCCKVHTESLWALTPVTCVLLQRDLKETSSLSCQYPS